jgi:hypothetical protein
MSALHERLRGPARSPIERFPFDPVERLIHSEWPGAANPLRSSIEFSVADIAVRLDAPPSQIYAFRKEGLTLRKADEFAIRLGTHPALLWPEQYCRTTHEPIERDAA